MKKNQLLVLALASLTLGACSSDDVTGGNGGPQWNENGKGYVNLAIQLPTQPSVRGANDHFDDGTPAEYEVKNATLILFVDNKVNSAYDMTVNFSMQQPGSDNITTTAKITQEINKVNGDIKALVVLNRNGVLTVENNTLKAGNADMTGKTLADLNTAVKDAIGTDYNWHEEGWLMSNAVLADVQGGSNEPSAAKAAGPLVTIAAKNIYKTKAEADANPAATVYVERAEAKVTLKSGASGTVTDGSKLTYAVNGWALDNTNQTNKLVRDVTTFDTWKAYGAANVTTNKYRFVGHTAVANNLYRVYWGDDYNYTDIAQTGLTTSDQIDKWNKADGAEAAYCFENTTDLTNMLEKNLTRVIVEAAFNNGASFYTVDEDRSKVWEEANVKKEVAARLLQDVQFSDWAKANLNEGQSLSSETDFDVTFSGEAAGQRTVATITLNEAGKAKLKKDAAAYPTNAATLANSHIRLDYYAGGKAYYPVYIKHFGDDLTPWSENDVLGNAIYGDEPKASQNYLGRYGVLRNNWYELNVTSIKSLGSPVVETVTNEPVDKKESYISVNINVLSWAKRVQNVEL